MAQQAKALTTEPGDLSSIPETHTWKERIDSESSTGMPWHAHTTHIPRMHRKEIKSNNF